MSTLQYYHNPLPPCGVALDDFSLTRAAEVKAYHERFPQYAPTPLRLLPTLARHMGIQALYVKDESTRFGQGAFKPLGASYAVGRWLSERLGLPMDPAQLLAPSVSEALGDVTFITATDGNHGRGLAWTAQQLHKRCVVYLPHGTVAERVNRIRALGAMAEVLPMNYDGCVQQAMRDAQENGWVLVQDTGWPGYETLPLWVMQGYLTLGAEIIEQMDAVHPTHIALQAGVGSFAAAMVALFTNRDPLHPPQFIIVEPNAADGCLRSVMASKLTTVPSELATTMAGLACGTPNPKAFSLLKDYAEHFVACPDALSEFGMRRLAHPDVGDPKIISGESGAVTVGAMTALAVSPECAAIRTQIGLDAHSVVLCISTEGATDIEHFMRVTQGKRAGGNVE